MWNSTFKNKPRTRLKRYREGTKKGEWGTAYADNKFSKYIRARDPMCRRCWIEPSDDCSHYWGRSNSATRFDPKNCIGLCRPCHDVWEHQKNNEYKKFMINWLGKDEYNTLETRARSFKKRSEAVAECKEFLISAQLNSSQIIK